MAKTYRGLRLDCIAPPPPRREYEYVALVVHASHLTELPNTATARIVHRQDVPNIVRRATKCDARIAQEPTPRGTLVRDNTQYDLLVLTVA